MTPKGGEVSQTVTVTLASYGGVETYVITKWLLLF